MTKNDPICRYLLFGFLLLLLLVFYETMWIYDYKQKNAQLKKMLNWKRPSPTLFRMMVHGNTRPPRRNWVLRETGIPGLFMGYHTREEAEAAPAIGSDFGEENL